MRSSARQPGFTLIEVLVVVGIIGLLVAILLPSLLKARNQARAVRCASNMRQVVTGTIAHLLDNEGRKQQWSTHFGWGVYSLRHNKGEGEIFTCPSDPAPQPIPAVVNHLYELRRNEFNNIETHYYGTRTGDSILNRVVQDAGRWTTDIQDGTVTTLPGGGGPVDPRGGLLLSYEPPSEDAGSAEMTAESCRVGLEDRVLTYAGQPLWTGVGASPGPPKPVPIMWMSYGANANAGIKGVKGAPVLAVEAGKLGVLPGVQSVGSALPATVDYGDYPRDHLARALRFRHGDRPRHKKALRGADYVHRALNDPPPNTGDLPPDRVDDEYDPRAKMNAAFLDGHVERLPYWDVFTLDGTDEAGMICNRPEPRWKIWGIVKQGSF